MRRAGVAVLVFTTFACKGGNRAGSPDGAVATSACSEGGACAREGETCSPAPIGTGWTHALHCMSGKWQAIEIAPLPQPADPPPATGPCKADSDCAVEDRTPSACCSRCGGQPMTVAARDAIQRACAGKSDFQHCGAPVTCPTPPKASCVKGTCTLAPPPK